MISKAVSLDKKNPEFCRIQAQIFEQLEETKMALKTWKKCLTYNVTEQQMNEANKHIKHLEAE